MIMTEEKKEISHSLTLTVGNSPVSENSGLSRQPTEEGAVFLSDESDSAGFDCPVCLEVM